MILLSKELVFPQEGDFYNTWSQMVDVSLHNGTPNHGYKLGPEAYQSATFDAELNYNKLCDRLLSTPSH